MNIDKLIEQSKGVMIGAAYGDSLGAAVEFMDWDDIEDSYGPRGITSCQPAFGHPAGVITDDTQMALATAEGLLATPAKKIFSEEIVLANIWKAYLDWYKLQSDPNERRGPGGTCLRSLAGGVKGTIESFLNLSQGCGGIMRAHPIGIAFYNDPERAFDLGIRSAALTHGHPNGYVPAGLLAKLIANILQGQAFIQAIDASINQPKGITDYQWQGTFRLVDRALEASPTKDTPKMINQLFSQAEKRPSKTGGGWLGHEALAIALCAARNSLDNPIKAVKIAVNHSGDSDSTGSICGAIMGALFGAKAFEDELRSTAVNLERKEELAVLGEKLANLALKEKGN